MCETCLLLVITEIDARFDIRIRIRIREDAKPNDGNCVGGSVHSGIPVIFM